MHVMQNEDLSSLIHTKMQNLFIAAEIYKLILDSRNYHPDVEIKSAHTLTTILHTHLLVEMV